MSDDHAVAESKSTEAPKIAEPSAITQSDSRLSKLKLAFFYVLIIGLVAAALTSVIALLIGNFFSAAVGKSLLTILIFFSHSLLILGVLWADRDNEVGRKLLPTSIIALVFASMISTTLGTWEIITPELAWRLQGLYFLIIGAVFVIIGTLRTRVAQQGVQLTAHITVGFTTAMVIAVAPWILNIVERFDPLYFRIVSALAILAATSFLITIVLRGIATGKNPELKKKDPNQKSIPGGLLAIYITVGTIAAMVWFTGFIGFIISSTENERVQPYSDSHYDNNYESRRNYR